MRIVCISDTHSMHRQIAQVPDGDVLVHAGDLLGMGMLRELEDLNDWFGSLPHTHKIVIAGNHDWCFQTKPDLARAAMTNVIYLEDSGIKIGDIEFWGSPYTPWFRDWAFNVERGKAIAAHWTKIPTTTDVLITHGPPHGILDAVIDAEEQMHVGCMDLFLKLEELDLKAHIFGHIHEGYGYGRREKDGVQFANACICTRRYRPTNSPIVIDI